MADSIFEPDELAADAQAPEIELTEADPSQQQPDRARDETGKFVATPEADPTEPPAGVPDGEAKPKGDGKVPQGALHAEREKRKGIEAELTKAREQLAAIQQMREQIAARKPEPLPEADDPAALEHLRQRIAQQDQTLNRFSQQMDSQAIQQAETQHIKAVMEQAENEYRSQQPDYDIALHYLVQGRTRELQRYGLGPVEVQQAIAEEAMDIVRNAVQQGQSPAEMAYQIAHDRGYRPTTADQGNDPAQQQQGGAQATLAAIAAAKSGSRSLGHAGGGSTPKTLNAETIAAMSESEFDALYSTPEGRRLVDGL